jgi:hypothetical protein
MANPKLVSIPQANDVDLAVATYKDISAKIKFLEEQLKAPKEVIEAAAAQTADGKIVTPEYKVTLSIVTRENFSLKNAKPVLGSALDPFISKSTYTQLKVS